MTFEQYLDTDNIEKFLMPAMLSAVTTESDREQVFWMGARAAILYMFQAIQVLEEEKRVQTAS